MEQYIIGPAIGSGSYATVYKAMDKKTGKTVALKKILLNEMEGMQSTALREISILKGISHPNIIKLLHIIHQVDFLTIVFEFVEYDLMSYIEANGNVLYLINQLVSAVQYLHASLIMHRDLKPHNILVTRDGILKIADFGLARHIGAIDYPYASKVVTLWYRAPELLQGSTDYRCEIDIWSLGCIIYEMIARRPLLPGTTDKEQLKLCKNLNLAKLQRNLRHYYSIPEFIIKIICRCLDSSPAKRITADEIVQFLKSNYNK